MVTEIQTAQDIWPQLDSIVYVPRTETDYRQLSSLRDELKTLIGASENHPLVSLMEVVAALIEKYESEQEAAERELGAVSLCRCLPEHTGKTNLSTQQICLNG